MFWYIIILLIIILLFITFKTITESFDLSYNNEENFILKDYENIPITDKIYEDINELLEIIDMDDNNIINIINGNSGMGSQLTLYLQTSSYIHDRNSKIICLPHFSNNNKNFKYHNKEYNNSFFMYFK